MKTYTPITQHTHTQKIDQIDLQIKLKFDWSTIEHGIDNVLMCFYQPIFTDKLSVQKETYNAICADMDTTFAEMAGF